MTTTDPVFRDEFGEIVVGHNRRRVHHPRRHRSRGASCLRRPPARRGRAAVRGNVVNLTIPIPRLQVAVGVQDKRKRLRIVGFMLGDVFIGLMWWGKPAEELAESETYRGTMKAHDASKLTAADAARDALCEAAEDMGETVCKLAEAAAEKERA